MLVNRFIISKRIVREQPAGMLGYARHSAGIPAGARPTLRLYLEHSVCGGAAPTPGSPLCA